MGTDIIIEAVSIRDQVADIIRRKIIRNEFVGGSKISEREISEMLKISTTPVKEAFRMLESEGILVAVPRKGTFVSELPKENLKSITVIRSSIEGAAAFFTASYATKDEMKIMEDSLNDALLCIKNDNKEGLLKNNNIFHNTIRTAARNNYLLNLLRTLKSIDESVRIVSLEKSKDQLLMDNDEHFRILEAIKKGQSKDAEELMIQHIRRVVDMTI